MTGAQETVLLTLQYGRTRDRISRATGYSPSTTQHILDGLYRRSLATLDPNRNTWHLTPRGSRTVIRILTREETPA